MRREGLRICLALLAGLLAIGNSISGDAPSKTIALVGGTIRTQTEAGEFVGTVVIKDKKIVAIGPNVAIPEDAQRIDVANCVITPGLIDIRSVLWLNSGAARENGRDASLNILDGIDPFAEDWRDAARQGVTAVYVQPNEGGSLGGAGAVLRVGPTASVPELVIRHPAGLQATLGAAAAAAPPAVNPMLAELLARLGLPAPPPQPAAAPTGNNALTRYAQYESLRAQFEAAKKYAESKPAQKDPGKELLSRVLKKEVPVRLEIAHEDDIRNSMKLSELGAKVVYERLDRVKNLPEELQGTSMAIVVGPMIGGKKSDELRKLALDGRRFALGTFADDARSTTWLRMHAAAAIHDGYPRERILTTVTRDAAELVGASDKLGQLAVDRVADLVVFAGEPLDPSVQVRMTISQGIVTHDDAKAAPVATAASAPSAASSFVANHVVTFDELSPDADAGHFRGKDGLARQDKKLTEFSSNGFGQVVVAPGSSNVLAGLVSEINSKEKGASHECGFKFVLTSASRNNERYPSSLVGQVELIRDRLKGKPSLTNLYLPSAITDAMLAQRDDHLKRVLDRKVASYFEVHTRAEIQAALGLIRDFNLRGVLVQPRQLDGLIDEIRDANVGIVVGPIRSSDTDKMIDGFVSLANAGVPLMLGGGDANDLRRTLAKLVNAGLPRPLARQVLEGHQAERFGLQPRTGNSLAIAAAEAFQWDGDPLDPGTRFVQRRSMDSNVQTAAEHAIEKAALNAATPGKD